VRAHGSYRELAEDTEVDAVYVASPHIGHAEHAELCIANGKAVLCEKPFAVTAGEARRMIATARLHKRFLMEAMWTRFLPVMAQVRTWLEEGAIGEPRMVTADFGFRCEMNPESRLLNPTLAGGALLDLGIYVLAFARMVFRERPIEIKGVADIGSTGVDEQAGIVLRYPGGRVAVLSCALRTCTPHEARVDGTAGRIVIPAFSRGTGAVMTQEGGMPVTQALPFAGTGYQFEAAEVGRCLRAGALESPVMPLDESLELMETMDALREQWGLRYPGETAAR